MTEPKLPRNFDSWLTPWHISTLYMLDDDNRLVEWKQWVRTYLEESHCGTPGCCQMDFPVMGPVLTEPTPVDMSDDST